MWLVKIKIGRRIRQLVFETKLRIYQATVNKTKYLKITLPDL